jgi:hypothetical protein
MRSERLPSAEELDLKPWEPKNEDLMQKYSRYLVEDKSLKNLMLAWYYAGYYTGLHDGQRNACQGAKTETKSSNAK